MLETGRGFGGRRVGNFPGRDQLARGIGLGLSSLILAVVPILRAAEVLAGPRVPPTEPGQAASTLAIRPGFTAELVAAEPLVTSPVALTVDEGGRAFVVEMRDYSERRPERLGRVRLLTDTNQDGRYDAATVFLPDLPWPTAIMSWDGGVFLGATPDILYAKDTDGDGVADLREVIFTGFASDYAPFATNQLNVQALMNSFQWGLDCQIHGATSMSGGQVTLVDSAFTRAWRKRGGKDLTEAAPTVDLRGRDFAFDPRTLELRAETGGGQHGMSLDDTGRKFVCSNSDHLQLVAFDEVAAPVNRFHDLPTSRRSIAADGSAAEVFRRSPDEPWRVVRTRWRVSGVVPGMVEGGGRASGYFTGATGVTIYRGDDYGRDFSGDAFIADCGSNLIHRKKLHPAVDGVLLVGERAADEQRSEFVASSDNWFRPVQFYNAPDGCLWAIDMYREVIEHPWSLPAPIKAELDLDSGRERGRLWRLKPLESSVPRTRTHLTDLSVTNLVATLAHANGWHRDTAARLLYQRGDAETQAALRAKAAHWSKMFPLGPTAATGRIQLLELLSNLGALEENVLLSAGRDESSSVRRYAYRLLARRTFRSAAGENLLLARAREETDALAGMELAFALASAPTAAKVEALGTLLRSESPWVRSAAVQAAGGLAPVLWTGLIPSPGVSSSAGQGAVLVELASTLGRTGDPEVLEKALAESCRLNPPSLAFRVTDALREGVRRRGGSLKVYDGTGALKVLLEEVAAQVSSGYLADISPEAVRLVPLLDSERALQMLPGRLSVDNSPAVREAALLALAQLGGESWARALAEVLVTVPAELRPRVQAMLVGRVEGANELLRRMELHELRLDQLDSTTLVALKAHGTPAVRTRARALLGEPPESRQAVVESFIAALDSPGDVDRGRVIFQERCASCHAWRGQGVALGPDLASVAANGREKLLVSILDPNREVVSTFAAWTAETTDGQTVSGILTRRTGTAVTLRQAGGAEVTLEIASVRDVRSESRSLMPEGLEAGLSPERLADLLAFLTAN